jgi:hypothetical protein
VEKMVEETLREVVEALAPLERAAGSPGEQEAAQWLAARLARAGAEARIEEEQFHPGYARELLPLSAMALVAGLAALRGRARFAAAAVGAAAAAAIADDVDNRRRVWRRLTVRPRTTWNVVTEAGDPEAANTLIVLAHHDAAPTGMVFDQTLQRAFAARFPQVVERTNTSPPMWWPVIGAPALMALGALTRRRGLVRAGIAGLLLHLVTGADIARGRIVPGANDNLSGTAALVALAERLRDEPVPGIRVVLASCGAEEVLQGGIHGFAARHFPSLSRERTWVLNLDSVGSPFLIMCEGEGTLRVEPYPGPEFRDRIADVARRAGIGLHRGVRARVSSDSVVPSRAGFPTAMLLSWDDQRLIPHYHLLTDTPEHLHYGTVASAVELCHAVAADLAA